MLVDLKPTASGNVLDQLWKSKKTFIQIISQDSFKAAIDQNNVMVSKKLNDEELINNAYTSPANKKALRQALKVVKDVINTTGKVPDIISLRFNRGRSTETELSLNRQRQLIRQYNLIKDDLLNSELKKNLKQASNKRILTDKEYLYFKQLGRDAFDGSPLDFDKIKTYHLSHILPANYVPDDSLNNLALTTQSNSIKRQSIC